MPLFVASERGQTAVAQLLLDSGTDKESEGPDGQRPLHVATMLDCLDVVQLLVEAGADTNALDERGRTAAQLVPRNGSIAAAELLRDDKRRWLS